MQIIIASASRCLNPKSALAVRELRLVMSLPRSIQCCFSTRVFMCSFTSFRSLTLWQTGHYLAKLYNSRPSCFGKTFVMWEHLTAHHVCSSSLMLKGRSQGCCGLVVSLGLDLCWTVLTIGFYMFCAWIHLHCTSRGTPLGLVLRGCLKQITRPHHHCGHRSGLAVSHPNTWGSWGNKEGWLAIPL